MKNSIIQIRPFFFLISILFVVGCGKTMVPVSGLITYHEKPAPDIQVFFQPVSDAATVPEAGIGLTDSSGRFELRSVISNKKGIEPGNYTVFMSWKDPNADPHPIDGVTKYNPTIYPDIAKGIQHGGLTFTVPANGSKEVNFELTAKPEGSSDKYSE